MQRLTKWGNSVGLRIHAGVLEAAGLKAGDYCYVRLLNSGDILVRPVRGGVQVDEPTEPTCALTSAAEVDAKW